MTETTIGQDEVSSDFRMKYESFLADEKAKLIEAFRTTFPGVGMSIEIETEYKYRGKEVGMTAVKLLINPGEHVKDMPKKLAVWKFDREESDGTDICYVAYIGMRGTEKYGLNAAHIQHVEEKYEIMAKDIKKFILSKRNAATERQVIEHFEHIYPEHDIRACMTPLLVAGVLTEKVVYMVND
jgi:hypothetical protein